MATPVAVTGKLTSTDGTPLAGAVRFQLPWDCWLADNTATVIQAKPIDVLAAADGTFSVTLFKSADLLPANSSYTVTEHFGPAVEAQYTIVVIAAGAIGSANVPITSSPALPAQYVTGPTGPPGSGMQVQVNSGAALPQEPHANFIAGAGIGIAGADNPGATRTDVTLSVPASTFDAFGAASTAQAAATAASDPSGSAATAQAYAIQRAHHTGTQTLSTISDAGTAASHPATDFDATGAAAAAQAAAIAASDTTGAAATAQAYAIQRAHHTGTQTLSTISDAGTAASHPATDFAPSSGIAESAVTNLTTDLSTLTTNVAEIETDLGEIAAAPNIPAWAALTAYVTGYVVVEASTLYQRNAGGTSAASWGLDAANWTVVGPVNETGLTLSDVTTDNVTTSAHGFTPKLSGINTDELHGDGVWAPPNQAARGLFMSTDFYNSDQYRAAPGWFAQAISGGNITGAASNTNQPGVIGLQNGVTTANSGWQFRAGSFYISGYEEAEFIFNPALLTATLTYLGLHNSLSAAVPTKGCWFDLNAATLSGKTAGSATTTTGTTYTMSQGTWYHAKLVVNSAGTACAFYLYTLNGTLVWSDTCAVTANMPAITDGLYSSVVTYNTASQAQTIITYLDYMSVKVPRALVR